MRVAIREPQLRACLRAGLRPSDLPDDYVVLGVSVTRSQVFVMISPSGDTIEEYPLADFDIVDATVAPMWTVAVGDDWLSMTFPEFQTRAFMEHLAEGIGGAFEAMKAVFEREGVAWIPSDIEHDNAGR